MRPREPQYPKADLIHRAVARFADVILAVLAARLLPGVGGLVAIAYLLLADGILMGQSPGKKLGGVKVVNVRTRQAARYLESALRNLPFALVAALWYLPIVGWVLFPVAGLFILAFEAYMAWTDRLGLRIGDVFADTQVIDGSIPIGDIEQARRPARVRTPDLSDGEPA